MREAVAGREHEFLGLGLIGAAVLLGLAIYFDLAGPLGTWRRDAVRLARRARPLRGSGGARRRSACRWSAEVATSSPFRLAVGWAMVAAGVARSAPRSFRGPDELTTDVDPLEARRRVARRARSPSPSKALLGPVGAAVVLLVVLVGGALLITQTSMRTMASHTGGFLATIAKPLVRWTKSGLSNVTTLSSDRAQGAADDRAPTAGPSRPSGRVRLRRGRRRLRRRSAGEPHEAVAPGQAEGVGRQPTGCGVTRRCHASASGSCRR